MNPPAQLCATDEDAPDAAFVEVELLLIGLDVRITVDDDDRVARVLFYSRHSATNERLQRIERGHCWHPPMFNTRGRHAREIICVKLPESAEACRSRVSRFRPDILDVQHHVLMFRHIDGLMDEHRVVPERKPGLLFRSVELHGASEHKRV